MNKQDLKKTKNAKCVGINRGLDIFCDPWDAGSMIMCDHYPGYCKPATPVPATPSPPTPPAPTPSAPTPAPATPAPSTPNPVPTPNTCTNYHGCDTLSKNGHTICYALDGDSFQCACKPGRHCVPLSKTPCGSTLNSISYLPVPWGAGSIRNNPHSFSCELNN
jgi:hypothetical protein